ncbi:MAG: hypothetical protein NVSMB19_07280 [Vulcanimicrobiaceae bacterium]
MKLLLVRADGIGDALACAPLVAALRAAGHAVGAVLGTSNRTIFAADALLAVHVLERIPWPAHGSTRASFATALAAARAERYDAALVASEEPEAFAFARAAGIALRVGFINGWAKPFKSLAVRALLTRAIVRPASARRAREHEVRTLFRLGTGFVNEREPTRDRDRLRAIVLGAGVPPAHDAVVVQASPKFAGCGLDGAAFAALARRLRTSGRDVIVCGDDAAFVETVARDGGVRAQSGLDVAGWKTCIAGARAVVTPDSGAAHVAGMLGVPTVDAFAPGPATAYDARRWAPWAAPYRTVTLDPARGSGGVAAMLASALDDVLANGRAA